MVCRKESMVKNPKSEQVPPQLRVKYLYLFAGPYYSPCHFLQVNLGDSSLALVNPTCTCPALPGSAQGSDQSWTGKHMR